MPAEGKRLPRCVMAARFHDQTFTIMSQPSRYKGRSMTSDLVVLAADLSAFIDATEPRRVEGPRSFEHWRARGRELLDRTRRYLSDPRHAQHLRSVLEDTSHNLQRFVRSLEASSPSGSS